MQQIDIKYHLLTLICILSVRHSQSFQTTFLGTRRINSLYRWNQVSTSVQRRYYVASPIDKVDEINSTEKQLQPQMSLSPDQEDYFNSLEKPVYGAPFIERLRELQGYKNEFGSCYVPKRYPDNPKLGNWVNKSRQMYRKYLQGEKSSMTPERIEALNKIGFIWSGFEDLSMAVPVSIGGSNIEGSSTDISRKNAAFKVNATWMRSFQELKQYMEEEKDAPSASSKLGAWAARQRRARQNLQLGVKTTMTEDRIELLESIGFDWSPWDTKWNMRIQELRDYKQRFGDCMVPVHWKENPKLGSWVSTQRKYYKLHKAGETARITKERIRQLTEVGFVWDRMEYLWNEEVGLHSL
uniref:Helicase-associated domain-containing protein n=1 Tax=Chaetoceros debilis TaxID=122233 RepID=A0A7S3PV21_9STRA|mmetsp:Transcript_6724/g.9898  ORF Transcript_6724/g.9898 Transcript_6724/m.9898 type:complete len:353 (+) Transcript_6724:119-1177(+)